MEENADRIEDFITDGSDFTAAVARVQQENKPVCHCCGQTIVKGLFCTDRIECRQAFHRYKWKRHKGVSKDQALQEESCQD